MKPLRESMEKNMMPVWKGKVKVLLSELKEADAAVLGASALGWEAKLPQTPSAVPVNPTPGV
jgi:glucokinase